MICPSVMQLWLLAIGYFPLVSGIAVEICNNMRDANGNLPASCGCRWALMNADTVIDFWEVHELKFFWDTECSNSRRVAQPPEQSIRDTYFSSSVMSVMPDNDAIEAFDGNVTSRWTANCRQLQGGCAPETQYVGLDIGEAEPQNVANPGEPAIYATVRCMQVWQSELLTRIAREVSIVTWVGILESDWVVLETFSAMGGGGWQTRPALDYQVFRMLNAEATEEPWRIGELLLYKDPFCVEQETKFLPISHGSFLADNCEEQFSCNDFPVEAAFDGVLGPESPLPAMGNEWVANCQEWQGCAEGQAWFGVDFGRAPEPNRAPVLVRCVRLLQPAHVGYPEFGRAHHTSAVRVEAWEYNNWRGLDMHSGRWSLTGLVPLTLFPGDWVATQPLAKYAWRLSNVDQTPDYWEVHELALYSQEDCGSFAIYDNSRGGTQFDVEGVAKYSTNPAVAPPDMELLCNMDSSACADLAFDGFASTSWVSTCNQCRSSSAAIGLIYARPEEIRCFRLWQGANAAHLVTAVQLEYWDGDAWIRSRREDSIGGGSWHFRPAPPQTAWRLVSLTHSIDAWTVAGVGFHSDSNCLHRYEAPRGNLLPIASSHEGLQGAALAFDHDARDPQRFVNETSWVASCQGLNDTDGLGVFACTSGEAWIGLQSGDGELEVNCLRLMQDRTRTRQIQAATLEFWDGTRWKSFVDRRFDFSELGGGATQTLPSLAGASWRLAAVAAPGSVGIAVSELELYTTPTCEQRLEAKYPNVFPICSGYATVTEVAIAVGDMQHIVRSDGSTAHGPGAAFDGNLGTMWAELQSDGAWVGLEFLAQDAPIQCIRIALGQLPSMRLHSAEVQGWEGLAWVRRFDAVGWVPTLNPLVIQLPRMNGAGWQSPLASAGHMWRLEPLEATASNRSWHVAELAFYESTVCDGESLQGSPMASLSLPGETDSLGGHEAPGRAFDNDLRTRWQSSCIGTCPVGEVWIGMDFGERRHVRCFRLLQGGRHDTKANGVALSEWDGSAFVRRRLEQGLAGGTWNQRPAPADTMWRLSWVKRGPECKDALFDYERAWGVTEIQFYSDDDCSNLLPFPGDGPVAIASGAPEGLWSGGGSMYIPDRVLPENAFDGNAETHWRAHCDSPREDLIGLVQPSASCRVGEEWIGLDFRIPVEVRCFRMLQERGEAPECCDVADEVRLDRWNGSAWRVAEWHHIPGDGSNNVLEIEGRFANLGACPLDGPLGNAGEEIWEQRHRRQSAECEVPLSGAVGLLADSICDKHDACIEAGFIGECCPTSNAKSKCCCSYLLKSTVFDDEVERDSAWRPLGLFPAVGLELFVIRSAQVLPYMGLACAVLFFLAMWSEDPLNGDWSRRFWFAAVKPLQDWMDTSPTMMAEAVRFMCKTHRQGTVQKWEVVLRFLVWSFLGFCLGGASLGLLCGYLLAEVFCKAFVNMSLVLKVAHAPIEVLPRERLVEPENPQETVVNVLRGIVWSLVLAARAIFDFILLRFSAADVGAVSINVSVPNILDSFPELPVAIGPSVDFIYDAMQYFAELFQEMFFAIFSGVPRCEGPVLIFSGTLIVMVVSTLVRWLNYDFFALFVGAVNSVMRSRPLFQQILCVTGLTILQAATFLIMQLVMLCLSRALLIANPLGNKLWMCPYGGETLAIVLGKSFLWIAALLGLTFAILCANGHFLGQDYITREIGNKVGLDLTDLDDQPGSTSRIRRGYYFSMLPTTLGIWIDGWNVNGYLIKERATVYAKQMKVPIICPYCKEQHVPYNEIIKVTGMQLSLNYQLAPMGAVFGKACEYLNDPPSIYIGTSLKCYYAKPHVENARKRMPRKRSWQKQIPAHLALMMAWCKDRFFPMCRRLLKVGLYVVILWMVFGIDETNFQERAKDGFSMILGLAGGLGMITFAIPAVIGLCLGIALVVVGGKKMKKKPTGKSKLPMVAETLHGTIVGMAVVFHLEDRPVFSSDWESRSSILVGTTVGVAFGIVFVAVTLFLRSLKGYKMVGPLMVMAYALNLGCMTGWMSSKRLPSEQANGLIVGMGLFFLVVTGLGLREPGPEFPNIMPTLFQWPKIVCAPYATIVGVPIGSLALDFLRQAEILNPLGRSLAGHGAAALVALPWVVAVAGVAERRPAQWASSVGHITALFVGYTVHWLLAPVSLVVVGTLIGAFVEWLDVRHKLKLMAMTEEELRRFNRQATVRSSRVLERAITSDTKYMTVYGRTSSMPSSAEDSDFDVMSPVSYKSGGEAAFGVLTRPSKPSQRWSQTSEGDLQQLTNHASDDGDVSPSQGDMQQILDAQASTASSTEQGSGGLRSSDSPGSPSDDEDETKEANESADNEEHEQLEDAMPAMKALPPHGLGTLLEEEDEEEEEESSDKCAHASSSTDRPGHEGEGSEEADPGRLPTEEEGLPDEGDGLPEHDAPADGEHTLPAITVSPAEGSDAALETRLEPYDAESAGPSEDLEYQESLMRQTYVKGRMKKHNTLAKMAKPKAQRGRKQ